MSLGSRNCHWKAGRIAKTSADVSSMLAENFSTVLLCFTSDLNKRAPLPGKNSCFRLGSAAGSWSIAFPFRTRVAFPALQPACLASVVNPCATLVSLFIKKKTLNDNHIIPTLSTTTCDLSKTSHPKVRNLQRSIRSKNFRTLGYRDKKKFTSERSQRRGKLWIKGKDYDDTEREKGKAGNKSAGVRHKESSLGRLAASTKPRKRRKSKRIQREDEH